ncbi:DEK domain-containing chromatin-associated protein 4 isoform X1 [Vitis vinifera]|uniref:DEK domain-containing chromatin-associated protein 4 isoform X1 n=1 Tax=Vitis vinifera TaxID=29760 RepID=UPI002882E98F|nr:DEK domain-containing chromatin-associated protein 4 isoform X1 [Vitis vinifera]
MGDETEVVAAAENGNGTTLPEKMESVMEKKEEENNGVKEMEEDSKGDEKVETEALEAEKMDEDLAAKEEKENKELEEKEEPKTEVMEEDNVSKENEASEEKVESKENVEEKVDGSKEKEKGGEIKDGKGPRKRGKGRSSGERVKDKVKEVEEKKVKEPRTPAASTIARPVRERKSVERLVASIERDSTKEFHIEKGRGTALKDIPNVAYKLSKRKSDDTFKLLHTILFGRRGKAFQVKNNISRFSGFVWHENEEKQKIKVKEKFDKCVKEKLLEFCDVLDISIAKTTTRKEDIVTKLIEFLVAPHPTTTVLLAEKEQVVHLNFKFIIKMPLYGTMFLLWLLSFYVCSIYQSIKGKKRKRVVKRNSSMSGSTSSKRSAKSRRKTEDTDTMEEKKSIHDSEDDSEEEDDKNEEEENENGIPERSEDEISEHSESEEKGNESEDESEEEIVKRKRDSKKTPVKKESAGKAKTKKTPTPKKSISPPKRSKKLSSNRSKADDDSDTSPKVFSRKKKNEVAKGRSSTPKKSVSKEKPGKKAVKGKDKPKEDKSSPSDDELRNAICEILKEVDFNTATFTDILKQLARQFETDLTARKSSIKLIIQEELTKLADEVDDEDEEGDAEKDEAQPASQEVEA